MDTLTALNICCYCPIHCINDVIFTFLPFTDILTGNLTFLFFRMKSLKFESYEKMHKDVCETMLSAGTLEDMDKLQYIMDRHSLGVMFDHNDELRAFIRESYDRLSVANNPPFPYYDTVWRVALEAIRSWFRR